MAAKAYTLYIIFLNIAAAILVLFYPEVSILFCAASAMCIMCALFLIKDFSYESENSEVTQLKIKLSVMTQERDSCIAHLDYHAKQPINK